MTFALASTTTADSAANRAASAGCLGPFAQPSASGGRPTAAGVWLTDRVSYPLPLRVPHNLSAAEVGAFQASGMYRTWAWSALHTVCPSLSVSVRNARLVRAASVAGISASIRRRSFAIVLRVRVE